MHNTNSKAILNIKDVIMMTMTGNFGIRWIAVAAAIGPSSSCLWLLGALIFFLPLSIIVAQLSRAYPDAGGMYAWVRNALGEKHGFNVAWLYWVTNIFYYPAILIFLATNLAYALGHPELAENSHYITVTSLIGFWLIVLISIFGLKISKIFISLGGWFGLFLPMLLLIIFGLMAYFVFGSATEFTLHTIFLGNKISENLPSLAMIMFAMAGVEVTATFANRVKNPKRDLYFGLLCGSFAIFLLYLIGTVMMNVIATPGTLSKTAGLMQAFHIIDLKFHTEWLSRTIAGALVFAELAAVVVWLIAPVTMFFACTPPGILPTYLHKTNQAGTPVNAILAQGILVSVVILITSLLPNINAMYQVLVLMSTTLYFIPYLYLAIAYAKSLTAIQFNKYLGLLIASAVFLCTAFGLGVSFVPSSDLHSAHEIFIYELELILGPLLFIFLGWLLYKHRKMKHG